MCGIYGIFSKEGFDPNILIDASKTMKHRGPDDEGYYISNEFTSHFLLGEDSIEQANLEHVESYSNIRVNVGIVHRRLSIIDITVNGHQPMAYAYGDNEIIITFNGEIYNYIELRKDLINKGYSFKTGSDTEVILVSYLEYGTDCIKKFIGMWAFAIYDKKKKILFCSRDRFGIKPFYYCFVKNIFAFASEIKLLHIHQITTPILNRNNAISFISYGDQSHGGETMFQNIFELQPSHNLIFDLCSYSIRIERYYNLKNSSIVFENVEDTFEMLLTDSIKLHSRSDVEIGTCLSGGLDSSTIVSLLHNPDLKYPIKTFSAIFPNQAIDESDFIHKLNNYYPFVAHYTSPNYSMFWKEFDKLIWHQDLPIQSTSPFAQWEVMKLANLNGIKVLLDGQGADEILGGYSEFVGAYLLKLLSNFKISALIKLARSLSLNYETSNYKNDLLRAIFQYLPNPIKSQIYKTKRIGPSFIKQSDLIDISIRKIDRRIMNSIRDTSIHSIETTLMTLLRYEDRNSMAFSIESRVPFLDHRLVEFCINLPDDYKIKNGWTKYILRNSNIHRLPKEINWRKEKLGFVTPEAKWSFAIKKNLIEYMNDSKAPDFIDKLAIIKNIENDSLNPINSSELWKIISFIKWIEIFNVKS
jgi:asparagine synthase (glutamine-hydrolysing)